MSEIKTLPCGHKAVTERVEPNDIWWELEDTHTCDRMILMELKAIREVLEGIRRNR